MKRFVNGAEAELGSATGAEIAEVDGRMMVRTPAGAFSAVAVRQGDAVLVSYQGRQFRIEKSPVGRAGRSAGLESGEIFAPMPGQIVDVLVKNGESVVHRQKLLVLEAMKTQQAFVAPFEGEVTELSAVVGQLVKEGERLALIRPLADSDRAV